MSHHTKLNTELESYKDAVWDYMLEHCDVTSRGSFFVKFHTSGRVEFQKHIRGRWKYNYHRKDERMDFTHLQKEKDATARKAAHQSLKLSKRHQNKKRKQEMADERHIESLPPFIRFIHMQLMQPLAQKWYTYIKNYVNIAKTTKEK